MRGSNMKIMTAAALALLSATLFTACTREVRAMDPEQFEQQYGVSGAYGGTVTTPDGPLQGTLVPITLANGGPGHLFIPRNQTNEPPGVYLRNDHRIHPLPLLSNVT